MTHAAIDKNDGMARFPSTSSVGVENKGLGNGCESGVCEDVVVYSLDSYVEQCGFVPLTIYPLMLKVLTLMCFSVVSTTPFLKSDSLTWNTIGWDPGKINHCWKP